MHELLNHKFSERKFFVVTPQSPKGDVHFSAYGSPLGDNECASA